MPRVEIPLTQVTDAGVAPPAQTNGDATNNHYISGNDGRIMLEVVSSDASSRNVTIETPGVVGSGLAIADQVIAVPAGATRLIGPFAPGVYNQGDGSIYVNPAISTTLKFRAYRL